MSAREGFRRITIDVPNEEHTKLKLMATLLGKSMHSVIVESIATQMKDFKGMEVFVEKLKKQNVIEQR